MGTNELIQDESAPSRNSARAPLPYTIMEDDDCDR